VWNFPDFGAVIVRLLWAVAALSAAVLGLASFVVYLLLRGNP
jgi:phage shock protein PspC (stress-responsive transcriptional regulator)